MNAKGRQFALLEGITAGALFGTAAILIRLSADVDAFSIALWRLIIASALLVLVVVAFSKRPSTGMIRSNLRHLLILGVLLGIHFILFISAVKDTTILNATVLVNTTPIFSMIISTFLYGIKPSKLALGGITLSFIGVGLIAYADAGRANPASLIGDLEAILAAFAGSFYLNYGKQKHGQLPILPTMLFIYLAATLLVGATIISTNKAFVIPSKLEMLLPLIGLGILPTAAAHTLYFSSLSNLKSFETATMALLEPLGATLLGIILFIEIPAPTFVLGAALVLAGIFAVASRD
jgi:drug/metabolite transporter (DMT)-like permease